MTAFLFIPSSGGLSRRVDLSNIASLFSEVEDLPQPPATGRLVFRAVAAALLVILAFGDTVLVNQPNVMTASASRHTIVGTVRAADM